jgi:hypothetical protein
MIIFASGEVISNTCSPTDGKFPKVVGSIFVLAGLPASVLLLETPPDFPDIFASNFLRASSKRGGIFG